MTIHNLKSESFLSLHVELLSLLQVSLVLIEIHPQPLKDVVVVIYSMVFILKVVSSFRRPLKGICHGCDSSQHHRLTADEGLLTQVSFTKMPEHATAIAAIDDCC